MVVDDGVVGGDGAGSDDRGRGEPSDGLGGEGSCAGGDETAGDAAAGAGCSPGGGGRSGTGAGGGAGPAGDVCAPGGRGRAELGEQQLLDQQQWADGQDHGERVVVVLELLAEERAALAAAHVAAGWRAELAEPLGHFAELEAHLLAAELARLGGLGERDARAYEQRLDGGDGGLHGVRDLLVGERVDLAQQQRSALRLG